MSTYANPPKVRSYVDHKPHSGSDDKPVYPRTYDAYYDHWPVDQTDIFFKPNRPYILSYIDHYSRTGDSLGAPTARPGLTTLSPNTAVHGVASVALTVNGTGFRIGAKVNFGTTVYTSTFVSATQLTATIAAADLTTAGSKSVTVTNPDSQISPALTFTIT
jgi:hypothetical protein